MKCYLCLVASTGITSLACAICQRCGAAMCEQHFVSLRLPYGMAGGGKQMLVCTWCCSGKADTYKQAQQHPSQEMRSQRERTSQRRWFGYWKRREPFPEPSRVVEAVEQLLKQLREQ